MRFVTGLRKTADMDHNNQGLEFQTQNEPAYGAGAAQVAPTGIPKYQPTGGAPSAKLNKQMKRQAGIQVAMGKIGGADPYASDGVGTQGQGADTLVTQLKWESSTPNNNPEDLGYNPSKRSGPRRGRETRTGKGMKKMSAFAIGFDKVADLAGVGKMIKRVGVGAASAGKSFAKGVGQSMSGSVGDALKMRGLGEIPKAVSQAGGLGKAVGTAGGRKAVAAGIGRAAPSLAVGAAGAVAAKKVYDKTLGSDNDKQNAGYYGYSNGS